MYLVAFSPDGTLAVSASRYDKLILWDVSSGAELKTFFGHDSAGSFGGLLSRWQDRALWERRPSIEAMGCRHRARDQKLCRSFRSRPFGDILPRRETGAVRKRRSAA